MSVIVSWRWSRLLLTIYGALLCLINLNSLPLFLLIICLIEVMLLCWSFKLWSIFDCFPIRFSCKHLILRGRWLLMIWILRYCWCFSGRQPILGLLFPWFVAGFTTRCLLEPAASLQVIGCTRTIQSLSTYLLAGHLAGRWASAVRSSRVLVLQNQCLYAFRQGLHHFNLLSCRLAYCRRRLPHPLLWQIRTRSSTLDTRTAPERELLMVL